MIGGNPRSIRTDRHARLVKARFDIEFDGAFPQGAVLIGDVAPDNEYQTREDRAAFAREAVARDPTNTVVLVTVMPGPQLRWAVPFCRALKARFPTVPIVWGGYFATVYTEAVAKDDPYESYRLLSEVLEKVRQEYVDGDKLTYHELIQGALKGMLGTLDPHSEFMDKSKFEELKKDTQGEFGGVADEGFGRRTEPGPAGARNCDLDRAAWAHPDSLDGPALSRAS